jgi:predicted metal-binding membrane protein
VEPFGPKRPLFAVFLPELDLNPMLDIRSWPMRLDRSVFLGGAAAVTALAWFSLLRMNFHSHHSIDFTATFLMWTVMMIAMMLPSALPFVFAFGAEHRKRRARNLPYVPAAVFLGGYFAMWTAFSAIAALVQQALHRAALLSSTTTGTNSVFAGGILIAAGVYQWTPFKDACLRHCRSPLSFLLSDWREGSLGAFRMGIDHGLFCLGCCWLLMVLPFAAGMMNLLWMAAITVFILVEKAAPGGLWFGKIGGAALAGAGLWMIASVGR